MNKRNRIKGALYGVAIGDALGGPLEFMSKEQIKRKHGTVTEMIGGGWLNLAPGEVTDDTQMTVAVIDGILQNPEKPIEAIGRNFIQWYKSGPKDIGGTCSRAINEAMRRGGDSPTYDNWMAAGQEVRRQSNGMNAGNGALMRTIYPALYYTDPKQAQTISVLIGNMTHFNDVSMASCDLYVDIVHKLIAGDTEVARKKIGSTVTTLKGHRNPTGYVLDSLVYALTATTETASFDDAVIWAVNQGGDADTIGAIAGGLAGAIYGYEAIPQRWIDALSPDIKAILDHATDRAVEQWEAKMQNA